MTRRRARIRKKPRQRQRQRRRLPVAAAGSEEDDDYVAEEEEEAESDSAGEEEDSGSESSEESYKFTDSDASSDEETAAPPKRRRRRSGDSDEEEEAVAPVAAVSRRRRRSRVSGEEATVVVRVSDDDFEEAPVAAGSRRRRGAMVSDEDFEEAPVARRRSRVSGEEATVAVRVSDEDFEEAPVAAGSRRRRGTMVSDEDFEEAPVARRQSRVSDEDYEEAVAVAAGSRRRCGARVWDEVVVVGGSRRGCGDRDVDYVVDDEEDDDDEEFNPDQEELGLVSPVGTKRGAISKKKRANARSKGGKKRFVEDDEDEDDEDEEFIPDQEDLELVSASEHTKSGTFSKKKQTKARKGVKKRKAVVKITNKRRRKVAESSDDDDDFDWGGEAGKKSRGKRRKKPVAARGRINKRTLVDTETEIETETEESDFVSSENDFVVENVSRKKRTAPKAREQGGAFSDSDSSDSSDSDYVVEDEVWEIENGGVLEKSMIEIVEKRNVEEEKGKGKEVDEALDVKECGICLAEEKKRTIQGVLDSCMHFFCFKCILKWSGVHTRCPTCRGRFHTITRSGVGLRKAETISVPERNQVYETSEEDLTLFMNLENFDNAVCMVCQLGGDDALMLLCDNCDSPVHTYCTGLGREVPEGDWYCEGCRSAAVPSSNSLDQEVATDHGTSSSDLLYGNMETKDLSMISANMDSHHSPSFQGQSSSQRIDLNVSPAHLSDEDHVASPVSGPWPSSTERRATDRDLHVRLSHNIPGQITNGSSDLQLRDTTVDHSNNNVSGVIGNGDLLANMHAREVMSHPGCSSSRMLSGSSSLHVQDIAEDQGTSSRSLSGAIRNEDSRTNMHARKAISLPGPSSSQSGYIVSGSSNLQVQDNAADQGTSSGNLSSVISTGDFRANMHARRAAPLHVQSSSPCRHLLSASSNLQVQDTAVDNVTSSSSFTGVTNMDDLRTNMHARKAIPGQSSSQSKDTLKVLGTTVDQVTDITNPSFVRTDDLRTNMNAKKAEFVLKPSTSPSENMLAGSSNVQVQDAAVDQGTSSSLSGVVMTEDLRTNMYSRKVVFFPGQSSSGSRDVLCGSSNLRVPDTVADQDTDSSILSGAISTEDLRTNMHARKLLSLPRQSSSLNEEVLSEPSKVQVQDTAVQHTISSGLSKTEDPRTNMHARKKPCLPGQPSTQRMDLNFSPRHTSGEDDGGLTQSGVASTISGRRHLNHCIRILLSRSRPGQTSDMAEVPRRYVEGKMSISEAPRGSGALHRAHGLSAMHNASAIESPRPNGRLVSQSTSASASHKLIEESRIRHGGGAKKQVKKMVKRILQNSQKVAPLECGNVKEIVQKSTHTILAACGYEHRRRMVAADVKPPNKCNHDSVNGPKSLVEGCCPSCFSAFVIDVVQKVID